MQVLVDNKLLRYFLERRSTKGLEALINDSIQQGILPKDSQNRIVFTWISLLEYLDLSALFENFFQFDENHPLFTFILSSLASGVQDELLFRLYDQVFVECLTHVKALPQINPQFLMDQIQKKNSYPLFSQAVEQFQERFALHPSQTMHDLILFLAWDRVCVNLAIVFEHSSADLKTQNGLRVLRECLLESFQHIMAQGRTVPGLFRLLEALYAFEMRQENLEIHTEEEWEIFCLAGSCLKPRNHLVDMHYIDYAFKQESALTVFTMDTIDQVKAAKSLARCLIHKSKLEHWNPTSVKVICVKEDANHFQELL